MVPNQYLPSQLGEIPNDWQRVLFSNVMKVRQGLQIAISKRLKKPTENSKEYITIQSIKKADQDREYVEAPSKRVICEKEDVLMTRTGNTGIVVTGVEGVFHNNFFLMDFNRSQIDAMFLVNYLRTIRVQHLILTKAGASTIPDLNHNDFYSIEFPLAPLSEQRKIAKILSTWDKAINTTERLIDNSKQQKKALMQQLLTGAHTQRKRLLDDSGKPFESEWEEVKLGEISYITTGSSNREDSTLVGEYAFFDRSEDIRTSSRYLFDSEAVIVPGEGQDFVPKHFNGKFDLHQRAYAIMEFKSSIGKFLFYYIGYYRHYFLSQAVGSTVKSLRLPMFQKMPIKLPSELEQQKIASVLTNADKEIELLEQQLADLKQEKKALMQQLLTGKRRVKIDEEAA
ncbi:MAG: restriction endonuclease subunit S [Methylococcales bacterium]